MTSALISRNQHVPLGVFYGCIAAFSFAMMSVFAKKIGHTLPTSTLMFFRFFISFILILPWIIRDANFTLKVHQPVRYMIRIISSFIAIFCTFYAIKFIPLVDTLLLSTTTPLFVPIIVLLMTGTKTSKKACIGIILGFIGVAVILHPGHEIFSFASLIALSAGLLAALSVVQIRLISKTSSALQILFYYFFVSTIVSGIAAYLQWQTPGNFITWFMLLGIGAFGALYQLFSTLSYATAPVRFMSPLLFLIVVFGGLFDWILWGYTPDVMTVSGSVLVITGALITVYFGHREVAQAKS